MPFNSHLKLWQCSLTYNMTIVPSLLGCVSFHWDDSSPVHLALDKSAMNISHYFFLLPKEVWRLVIRFSLSSVDKSFRSHLETQKLLPTWVFLNTTWYWQWAMGKCRTELPVDSSNEPSGEITLSRFSLTLKIFHHRRQLFKSNLEILPGECFTYADFSQGQ